jgi:hypothetical protein
LFGNLNLKLNFSLKEEKKENFGKNLIGKLNIKKKENFGKNAIGIKNNV